MCFSEAFFSYRVLELAHVGPWAVVRSNERFPVTVTASVSLERHWEENKNPRKFSFTSKRYRIILKFSTEPI